MRLFSILLLLLATSCNDVEIGRSRDVSSGSIYSEYSITAEEGKEEVTCMFRFRFGGPDGTTLLLEEPAKVELDGQLLQADSSRYSGAFYEVSIPLKKFRGRHSIVFTDPDGNVHKENFEFNPFELAAEIPSSLRKKPFELKFTNLTGPESLRLLMTDTVFESDDVNEMVMVEKSRLRIDSAMLSRIGKGPVSLELHREEEIPLKNGTPEGGRIIINYSLKREFEFR